MTNLLKRLFGLLAVLLGAAILASVVARPWLHLDRELGIGQVAGRIALSLVFLYHGRRWLLNLIPLTVLAVDPDDPEILEAQRQAQAALPRFWAYLDENRHECFVKFPMETRDGDTEHIWAVVHVRSEDGVVVSLANDPIDQPKDGSGRRVVPISDIGDWQVMISETEIRGGYSVKALERIAYARGHRLSRADKKRLQVFVDFQD